MARYAALDIGTVTCRLLVADYDGVNFDVLHRGYGITNLGEGVDATGMLRPEAIDRVSQQVRLYQDVISSFIDEEHPAIGTVALATSAMRDARNGFELVDRLATLGLRLDVISGEREAELTFLGASQEHPDENLLVVDIGGGSTELVYGRAGQKPAKRRSFDIGCRRVTERFLPSDPPTVEERHLAQVWIAQQFSGFFNELAKEGCAIDKVVAVAGTATSVVSIDQQMAVYDSEKVHGTAVAQEVLARVKDLVESCALIERQQIVGLDPERAPVIVAGMIILEEVLKGARHERFIVSEADILQGIIIDLAHEVESAS